MGTDEHDRDADDTRDDDRTPTTTSRRAFVAGTLAAGAALIGCGGDDAASAPASSTSGGGSGGEGGAGTGGGGGDGGAGGGPAPLSPPEAFPESPEFPLGVSSGDAHPNDVLLWARYTGSKQLLAVVYAMSGDDYVAEVGSFVATPADGGFCHVPADGLDPGTWYRFVFFELDGGERITRSRVGRFRTAIAADALEPLVFGGVSCTKSSEPFAPLARAAEHTDLDAFLFLGDNAYCDGAETVADYRTKYVEHFGKSEHIALRASTSMLVTWDDHEVANDYNPETVDPAKLDAARQVFFEHAAIERVADAPDRIWRSVRWGLTVEVFVLDCRSERRPSADEYISPEQMAWLKAGLSQSPAVFKVIMNSVPITDMPLLWDAYQVDRWEGYDAQRTEILEHIDQQGIGGVLWVAGDFHLAFIARVAKSGAGSSQLEVLVGPGAQSPNVLVGTLDPPQFDWATGENNFTALHFAPTTKKVRIVHFGADGNPLHDAQYDL